MARALVGQFLNARHLRPERRTDRRQEIVERPIRRPLRCRARRRPDLSPVEEVVLGRHGQLLPRADHRPGRCLTQHVLLSHPIAIGGPAEIGAWRGLGLRGRGWPQGPDDPDVRLEWNRNSARFSPGGHLICGVRTNVDRYRPPFTQETCPAFPHRNQYWPAYARVDPPVGRFWEGDNLKEYRNLPGADYRRCMESPGSAGGRSGRASTRLISGERHGLRFSPRSRRGLSGIYAVDKWRATVGRPAHDSGRSDVSPSGRCGARVCGRA